MPLCALNVICQIFYINRNDFPISDCFVCFVVEALSYVFAESNKKVQVGKYQAKAQSKKIPIPKNRGGKKLNLTIRYL